MSKLYCSLVLFGSLAVSTHCVALPTIITGETINLTKSDFAVIKERYSVKDGEPQYAETGYEFPFETLIIGQNSILDFNLSGSVYSAWYSSNFAMDFQLYCENTLVAEDRAFGVRYQQVSYSATPYINTRSIAVPDGCGSGKLVLTKVGNLSRAFYTRIQDINLNLTINKPY
ncbi:hypothetical protein [Pseudoalteromonas piscicida]|uniref:hypothetical protein n=1 Tax=Pseudoalteromonas piscicida TaxID=43662 RepID=UPI0005FA3C57|nr:hypothetical protein [Pseudoalteromonas piscicida]KJY96742.1 hypothetical protein TW73_16025 [Pseudoalteromonas piscicida]